MKTLLITTLFTLSLLGDEMQRLDSIVKDITNLRKDYSTCKASLKNKELIKVDMVEYKDNNELNKYKQLLKDERNKNTRLNKTINSLTLKYADIKSKKTDKIRKVQKNKKKIKPKLEKKIKIKLVEVVKIVEVCSDTPPIDPNPFPKLMPKEIESDVSPR